MLIEVLRDAAERLEESEGTQLFPGWDDGDENEYTERYNAIRRAAAAILAEGLSCDEGTTVSLKDVGCLVRYIADMQE